MLTGRQQEIWDFLVDYVDAHGYPPTVREIGEAVGLASPSTVHAHLANLERAGLLKRDPTKPRALELVGRERREAPAATLDKLPLVGQIAAGGPLLAEQNVEDHLAVPETLRGDFLLRVKGDSMIERRHPRRRHRRRAARAGRAQRRDRRRARRRRRVGRRGDREALLPRERAASACSRRTTRSSRSTRQHVQILGRVDGSVPRAVSSVAPLHRTLEQELQALLRGASLECLVCGEFVLHARRHDHLSGVRLDACARGSRSEQTQLQFDSQAG